MADAAGVGDIQLKGRASGDSIGAPVPGKPTVINPSDVDRARNNGDGGNGTGNGNSNGTGGGSATPGIARKRGRQLGWRKSAPSVPVAVDLSGLTGILLAAHELVAKTTGHPELALNPPEAVALTKCAENVARHYGIQASQKALDWAALVMTAGGIYGLRATAISMKQRKAAKDAAENKVVRPYAVGNGGFVSAPQQ